MCGGMGRPSGGTVLAAGAAALGAAPSSAQLMRVHRVGFTRGKGPALVDAGYGVQVAYGVFSEMLQLSTAE